MDEDSPGQCELGPIVRQVANGTQTAINVLSKTWLEYALNKQMSSTVTVMTKETAQQFAKEHAESEVPNTRFHLQSVKIDSVIWDRTDSRVSKEVLQWKILPSKVSRRFVVQHSKSKGQGITQ